MKHLFVLGAFILSFSACKKEVQSDKEALPVDNT